MTPMRGYSFMIDAGLAEALKTVKERDGISEGEQIRRALRVWFQEKGVMKPERKRVAARKRS